MVNEEVLMNKIFYYHHVCVWIMNFMSILFVMLYGEAYFNVRWEMKK